MKTVEQFAALLAGARTGDEFLMAVALMRADVAISVVEIATTADRMLRNDVVPHDVPKGVLEALMVHVRTLNADAHRFVEKVEATRGPQ